MPGRKKKLPIFRSNNNNGNNNEVKMKEMDSYRKSLGDRQSIYLILEKHKDLDEYQIEFINDLFKTLRKFDCLGMTQEKSILTLSKIYSQLCQMEDKVIEDSDVLLDIDLVATKQLGFEVNKPSQFWRTKNSLDKLFTNMFYETLNITLSHFEELREQQEEVSISEDKTEMKKIAFLNEMREKAKNKNKGVI